jgi:hypothetical protein
VQSLDPGQMANLTEGLSTLSARNKLVEYRIAELENLTKNLSDRGYAIRLASINRLHKEIPIAGRIANISRFVETRDESLDEESMKLAIELEAEGTLIAKLSAYAQEKRDAQLISRTGALDREARVFRDDYEKNYLPLLENFLDIDIDDWDKDGVSNNDDPNIDGDRRPDGVDPDKDNDGIPDSEDFVEEVYRESLDDRFGVE